MAKRKYFNKLKFATNLAIKVNGKNRKLPIVEGINEVDERIAVNYPSVFELVEEKVEITVEKTDDEIVAEQEALANMPNEYKDEVNVETEVEKPARKKRARKPKLKQEETEIVEDVVEEEKGE